MSQQQPQPYPQQQQPAYYAPQPPPKKSHTLRNVLLALALLTLLFIGGCLAVAGLAVNEVDKAIENEIAEDSQPGRADAPMAISEGKAFEVDGFKYAAGWDITAEYDLAHVTGLKVTNERAEKDSALVEIKLWKGSEVLAVIDCTTEQITPGTTTTVDCFSTDQLLAKWSKVTINDTF